MIFQIVIIQIMDYEDYDYSLIPPELFLAIKHVIGPGLQLLSLKVIIISQFSEKTGITNYDIHDLSEWVTF